MRYKETTIIKYMIENKIEELNILKISKALKMEKEKMEEYSMWYRINNLIAGPYYIISLLYLILYIILIIRVITMPDFLKPFLRYYYVGFPLFLFSIYVAFSGFLLKSME